MNIGLRAANEKLYNALTYGIGITEFVGGKLQVTLARFNDDKTAIVKALVRNWYKVRTERVFHQRLAELLP